MAVLPSSPWRRVAPGDSPAPSGSFTGAERLKPYADLFFAANQRGLNPNEVKATEVWEVASALGVGMQDDLQAPDDKAPGPTGGVLPSETIRQRVLAAEGLAPEPEARETRLEDLASLQDVMM